MNENNNCCLAKVLKVIEVLQKNVTNIECNDDQSCVKPFLGNTAKSICFNTRPVTFYTCDTDLLTVSYQTTEDNISQTLTSSVFRVEKTDGCCCTCSILQTNPDTTDTNSPYIETNQYVTINLNCIAAIKCLPDVIVNCI